MLNGRLYRAAFVPFLFALAIAAFSLGSRPRPVTATLAPDAFEGASAMAELKTLVAKFPNRRPGSEGDRRLARYVAHAIEGLGGAAGGGFSVHTYSYSAQTIEGERTLTTVLAERPGSTGASPILIVAHRDAAAPGSEAELSGTAALLELARVFASRETKRTIVLASTSGGSGGDAGAALLPEQASTQFDAAIVLGDVAGAQSHAPYVVPYSDGIGSAPLELQRTVSSAITQQLGANPGEPSSLGQLAHLMLPLAVGEQGPLNAAGLPAVLVQVSGERGPTPGDGVNAARMEGFGRAVLSSVDALDTAGDVSTTMQTGLLVHRMIMPRWVLSLLVLTLLLPPIVAAVDALARVRRRGLAIGRATAWTLSCALPFFAAVLFVYVLSALGIIGAAPSVPVPASALPFHGSAVAVVVTVALTLALAWLLWGLLVRRLGWGVRPDPQVSGLATLLVAIPLGVVVWAANPFAALLVLPALHLWLALSSRERLGIGRRSVRAASLGLVVLSLLPLAGLAYFYARQLGLGPGALAWTATLLLAGGHVGFAAALVWCIALGCVAAAAILAVAPSVPPVGPRLADGMEVTIRGPLSYAGPGSLGGTQSALRR